MLTFPQPAKVLIVWLQPGAVKSGGHNTQGAKLICRLRWSDDTSRRDQRCYSTIRLGWANICLTPCQRSSRGECRDLLARQEHGARLREAVLMRAGFISRSVSTALTEDLLFCGV